MRFEGVKVVQRNDELQQLLENERVFEVSLDGSTKIDNIINWVIDLGDGYEGYIPEQESGTEFMSEFVGQTVYAKITSINHEAKTVQLSRSAAIGFMRGRLRVKAGDKVNAAVKFVAKNQVHVDVGGGVMASMNRQKATLSRKPLHQLFQSGQIIQVEVEETEPEIIVSRAKTLTDPWQSISYEKNDQVAGTVVRAREGSVLIEVREGLVGIAPMPLTYEVATGNRVRCQVVRMKPERRQLRLRVKGIVS